MTRDHEEEDLARLMFGQRHMRGRDQRTNDSSCGQSQSRVRCVGSISPEKPYVLCIDASTTLSSYARIAAVW
jgi:hypothetical protein